MKNNEFITIKGARENNLKNVSLSLPRNKLIVFTGLSGSGKSSLAFNTIYEEGRRRYVDSLSSYARMFLGGTKKPNVDSIEGLSPSISIEQKTVHNNPRSTVGTITEIFDYFRLLFARIGIPHCPTHKIKITGQSSKDILNEIYKQPENSKLIIYSPVVDSQKGTHQNLLDSLIKENYLRVRINKQIYNLDEKITLNKNNKHSIDIIVNRVVLNENNYNKIAESIEIATEKSDGIVIVENLDLNKEFMFSKKHSCIHKDFSMPKIETRLFSFNAPYGMCEDCKGLGIQYKADFESIIPEMWKTLEGGAIKYFENTVNSMNMEWQEFKIMLNHYKVPLDVPVDELKKEWIEYIKYGTKVEDEKLSYSITSVNGNTVNRYGYIEGILDKIERMYYETSSDRTREYLNKFMGSFTCGSCKGARLNKNALAVWINGKNINDYIQLSISDCLIEIENLVENHLTNQEKQISNLITKEIINRLTFLKNVGLTYLNLNRATETLSGGEAQRIRLATQIGSNLTGVLYVLDELL